jgi:hypothetical protein
LSIFRIHPATGTVNMSQIHMEKVIKSIFLKPRVIIGIAIGLVCLILYTITMAPDIGAHDVAEWQATGSSLGIAHAPGSPAYTLISYLFTLLPLGALAARVTYVSVVMAAAGVVAVYVFTLLLFGRLLPALVAAATLAVAGMWWGHAAVATPYNAVITIMAVLLVLLFLWSKNGNIRLLWGAALLAGVGVAYHPTVMFFLPVPIAGIFFLGPWRTLLKPKSGLILLLLFVAGLSSYLYLPIRSAMDPPFMYQKIDSLSTFINYASASHARDTKLRESVLPDVDEANDRLGEVVYSSYYPPYIWVTFAPAMLLLFPGVWRKLHRIRGWLGFLAAGMVAHVLIIFILSDIYAHYYLPLLFYFSVWAGFSIYLIEITFDILIRAIRWHQLAAIGAGAVYLLLLAAGLPHSWDFANHREDRTMRNYVKFVFEKARPGAVVMATWESYTGLNYAQKVEGRRPDIVLMSVTDEYLNKVLPNVPEEKAAHPSSDILISASYNIKNPGDAVTRDAMTYGSKHPLSIKALTYQDFNHGGPYPVATRLYQIFPNVMNY